MHTHARTHTHTHTCTHTHTHTHAHTPQPCRRNVVVFACQTLVFLSGLCGIQSLSFLSLYPALPPSRVCVCVWFRSRWMSRVCYFAGHSRVCPCWVLGILGKELECWYIWVVKYIVLQVQHSLIRSCSGVPFFRHGSGSWSIWNNPHSSHNTCAKQGYFHNTTQHGTKPGCKHARRAQPQVWSYTDSAYTPWSQLLPMTLLPLSREFGLP